MISFARGVTREVILVGRWAIKFPTFRSWRMFLWGLLSNMQEVTWGKAMKVESGAKQYWSERLCPVLWSLPGGWLVVMRRVERVCTENAEVDYDNFKGLPGDHKPENFGWLDGRVVMLDYGSLT